MKLLKVAFFGLGLAIAVSAVSGPVLADDVKAGKAVFKKKCKVCHRIGKNKTGPNLAGVVGRPAGQVEGFKYSKAMRTSGLTWDEATLDTYLKKPRGLVKKTKMAFAGLKKAKDRAAVIAYLKSTK